MSKLRTTGLPLFTLCLMILSAATVLPDKIVGRNLFYLIITIVLITSCIYIKKWRPCRENVILATAFLLFGLSQLIWTLRFPGTSESIYMADLNYPRTGAYLLLSAILVLFLPAFISSLDLSQIQKIILVALVIIGFSYMCGRGLYYSYTTPEDRLRIDNSATMSAYLVELQSFTALFLIRALNCRGKVILSLFVVALTALVLLLTETRSALLLYPVLLLSFIVINRVVSFKWIVGGTIAASGVLILITSLFFHSVVERLNGTYDEISDYQTNNDTSFGARISMWKSGLYAVAQHPGGQSAATRYVEVKHYMDKYERSNAEGIRNIVYHLHNDVIDSLSLQGILGGLSVIFLYFSLAYFFYKKEIFLSAMPLLVVPVIITGMADTLFINDRFIVMFCMQICLFSAIADMRLKKTMIATEK